jgi:DNA-binding NtrC family response regulator
MSTATLDVLVVDDEPAIREVLLLRLNDWGYRGVAVGAAAEAEAAIRARRPDVVLTDVVLPGLSGLDLLRVFRAHDPTLPVILMTAHGNVDAAVEAMKEGAIDFLTKPIDAGTLRALLGSIAEETWRRAADRVLDTALEQDGTGLIGESRSIREARHLLEQLGASDATALITGESGTGKEVAARMLHACSARRNHPFVAVNAAAIPDGLIESEVFGHEVGAFTGAMKAHAGCFEQANGGTLFLDEIAEMPLQLQPKLLRVLEDGRVRRIGGTVEKSFDVRVVAATNRPTADSVANGRLRTDLLYRLNVFEIVLPPLRDRAEDIPLLVRHFLRVFNAKHGAAVQGARASTLERLAAWHWPGNVRELRNVMERAVVLARAGVIEASHLPPYLVAASPGSERPIELPPRTTMAEAERVLILETLERAGNNKAEAARQLGLDVKTIRTRLKVWGVVS